MAKVLVIDDAAAIRDAIVELLRRGGHSPAAAASVDEGLAYATSHPVDVVITDMTLPGHDGFTAMERFRRRLPDVAVIAMSGGRTLGMNDVLEIARCLGTATMGKPVTTSRLGDVVDGALGNAASGGTGPFLPAELAPPAEVAAMHARVMGALMLVQTLDALPGIVLLLNRQRQTVFANRAALARLGYRDISEAVGLRPGRLMHCAHAGDTACGTTEFCRYCGAGQALAGAVRARTTEKECRIASTLAGGELDLRVGARPFLVGDDQLVLLSITDIGDEKRREALEAMFFHDVLNTAGGIHGLARLIPMSPPDDVPLMQRALEAASDTLVDEIQMQRDLTRAERGELAVSPAQLEAHAMLGVVADHYRAHQVASGKAIVVEPATAAIPLATDPTILGRVLGNMVKNALEAVGSGATVTLSATRADAAVRFAVQNAGRMPDAAQKQIFQRSYSTKGAARGLGTYGMRLLTERYLGGRVWFESDDERGTRFIAEVPAGT